MITFMPELLNVALLFGVGIAAGFLNVMAGGGSTLALPVLIFMGLDSSLANGTNRVAIFIQNIAAVGSFRQQNVYQFKESTLLSLWTLPGAIAGALTAVTISDETFQRILAIVIIGIILSMFYNPSKTQIQTNSTLRKQWLLYLSLFATGFYGGFIQVGVGFLFMAALYHIASMNLVTVNMHKVFIVLVYTIPVLVIFMLTDNVDWLMGLILGMGSAVGGWWAARVSVKKGEGAIRLLLIIALAIMALKLLGVF